MSVPPPPRRAVSPLDREVEDRIVAMLERVATPLPRNQLFARFDDDFESEEDLARVLGRLVANGRLLREKRPSPAGEEFVYRAPNGSRVDAIAAAAAKVTAISPQPASSPEETPMAKKPTLDRVEQIVEFLKQEGKWFMPNEIAEALGASRTNTGERLRTLASEKRVQTVGRGRGLYYAATGVAARNAEEPKPPRPAPAKVEARKDDAPQPARRATPNLPTTTPAPDAISWAITDKGHVAINDGKSTIRLSPADIAYGVRFLERSQLLWMDTK